MMPKRLNRLQKGSNTSVFTAISRPNSSARKSILDPNSSTRISLAQRGEKNNSTGSVHTYHDYKTHSGKSRKRRMPKSPTGVTPGFEDRIHRRRSASITIHNGSGDVMGKEVIDYDERDQEDMRLTHVNTKGSDESHAGTHISYSKKQEYGDPETIYYNNFHCLCCCICWIDLNHLFLAHLRASNYFGYPSIITAIVMIFILLLYSESDNNFWEDGSDIFGSERQQTSIYCEQIWREKFLARPINSLVVCGLYCFLGIFLIQLSYL
eukprot:UN24676